VISSTRSGIGRAVGHDDGDTGTGATFVNGQQHGKPACVEEADAGQVDDELAGVAFGQDRCQAVGELVGGGDVHFADDCDHCCRRVGPGGCEAQP
jgi:hypothetical protein